MSSPSSPNGPTTAQSRLTQVKDFLTFNKTATTAPFDPDSTIFPLRKDLLPIPGAPPGAAWVWGDDDYVCFSILSFGIGLGRVEGNDLWTEGAE